MTYPKNPSTVNKKKYYEFIQNVHLFIPVEQISSNFGKLIEKYPVTPYLDDRESFIKWMHFIHNKINEKLEKPELSLNDFLIKYYDNYKPTNAKLLEYTKFKEQLIYVGLVFVLILLSYYFYEK
jgi:hypothetical protein